MPCLSQQKQQIQALETSQEENGTCSVQIALQRAQSVLLPVADFKTSSVLTSSCSKASHAVTQATAALEQ